MRSLLALIVTVWLLIGAFAGFQRGNYSTDNTNCAGLSTIAVTIAAGPLNYFGVDPELDECPKPPKPSK